MFPKTAAFPKTQLSAERSTLPKEPSRREKSPRTIIRERRAAQFSRLSSSNVSEPQSGSKATDRRVVVLSERDSITEARVEVNPQDPSIPVTNRMSICISTISEDREDEVVLNPSGRIVHLESSSVEPMPFEHSSNSSANIVVETEVAAVIENPSDPILTATTLDEVSPLNPSTIVSDVLGNPVITAEIGVEIEIHPPVVEQDLAPASEPL